MNETGRLSRAIPIVVLALFVAFFVIVEILSGRGNNLANLAKFLSVACLVFGVIKPKGALFLLAFLAGYSDLFKRMMVLYGRIDTVDLIYVLAPAPILMSAAVLGTLIQWLLGSVKLSRKDFIAAALAGALFAAIAASALGSGLGVTGSLQRMANAGSYLFLVPLIGIHFRDSKELLGYLKFIVMVFVPVALYAVWQGFFGLADFELAYLRTGLSIESRQLAMEIPRPFSTLNSARALTVAMATGAGLILTLGVYRAGGVIRGALRPLHVFGFLLFTAAMIFTLTRAGWLGWCVMLASFVMFGGRLRTLFFYSSGAVTIVALYFLSGWMLREIRWIKDDTRSFGSAFTNQALFIGTWQDRLVGFNNLTTNRRLWSLFGVDERYIREKSDADTNTGTFMDRRSNSYYHDALTGFIVKYGFVPTAIMFAIVIWMLVRVHGTLLRTRDPRSRMLLRSLLAVGAGIAAGGMTSSAALVLFPINMMFFVLAGGILELTEQERSRQHVRVTQPRSLPGAIRNRGLAHG